MEHIGHVMVLAIWLTVVAVGYGLWKECKQLVREILPRKRKRNRKRHRVEIMLRKGILEKVYPEE